MSADRVTKQKKNSSSRRSALFLSILSDCVTMKPCSSCEARTIPDCQVSRKDPSKCAECVRAGRADCDVTGPSAQQLAKIGSNYHKLEAEMAAAEEERRVLDAKVERLRKQKRLWFEKMMRALRRGIDSVEELERIEKEEAEREAAKEAEGRPPSAGSFSEIPEADFDLVYPMTLSPRTLEQFGMFEGTAAAPAGSSPGST